MCRSSLPIRFVLFLLLLTFIGQLFGCGHDEDGDASPPTIIITAHCGNDVAEPGEVCDGADLRGESCASQGFDAGTLRCGDGCQVLDTTGCRIEEEEEGPICGDGVAEGNESCDGADLLGASCASLGFDEGALACRSDCAFDTSGCAAPPGCGDGEREGNEVCDGADLDGKTCVSLGYDGGELSCLSNCTDFDRRDCFEDEEPVEPVYECNYPAFRQDGALDFNVETVIITGEVRLNGAQMPDNGLGTTNTFDRGFLRFTNVETGAYYAVALSPQGPATYTVELYKGNYDVTLFPQSKDRQDVLPPYGHRLRANQAFTQDGVLDYDAETVTVTGEVRLNGAQMPDNGLGTSEIYFRGLLRFTDRRIGTYEDYVLSMTGPASYRVTLFKGNYDVTLRPQSAQRQDVLPPYEHGLRANHAFMQNGALDYDVETVEITGELRLNGGQVPDNGRGSSDVYYRGHLRFMDKSIGAYFDSRLSASGPALYHVTLYKGTYDVTLHPQGATWQDALPPYEHRLLENRIFTQNVGLDYDVETVTITGQLRLNGAQMPDNRRGTTDSYHRGHLRFTDTSIGAYLDFRIAPTGPANYHVDLYKGAYDVTLRPQDSGRQDVMPPYDYRLRENEAFTQNGALDYDAETVTITGEVRLNGDQVPDNGRGSSASHYRGHLRFTNKKLGNHLDYRLSITGPMGYSIELYKGTYDVIIVPQHQNSQDVMPPYNHRLVEDQSFIQDGALDYDAETVTLTGQVRLNGAPIPDNGSGSSDSYFRGDLRFTDRITGAEFDYRLSTSGPASYSVELYKGAYDVDLVPQSESMQDVLPPYLERLARACN